MYIVALCVSAVLLPALPQAATSQPAALVARVDPRVELMSIIFRLAGHPEYNMPNSQSAYSTAVEEQFGGFRDHAVVKLARELRARRGVSYDAVMSMAVHLTDTRELKERVPFDLPPARLDQRWHAAEAREFLERAREFVAESKFNDFCTAQRKLYSAAGKRLTKKLSERGYLKWFDKFFGARPGAEFHVFVGLLNGGGNYGVGIRYPDGREEITPVIGVSEFDDEGVPEFGDGLVPTVVHEFCHSYTNPLVDTHFAALQPAAERIFAHCEDTMRDQAYGSAQTVLYESLVRACVVRYTHATDGASAAKRQIEAEHARGFEWIGELAERLAEYEVNRAKYPTLDAFMPRIVAFFNEYAPRYEALQKDAPQVKSMTPVNGAQDVDPNLKEIRIEFDRPMRDQSWSIVGGGPHFPELAGKPAYDAARRVLTVPVRLKPGWSYEFWLNRNEYRGFVSEDGQPLKPVAVTFETRAE